MTCYPSLYKKATACIFVCRMHDELDDYPPVDLYKDGSSIGPTHKSRLTNRQLLQQFMSTMRSFNFIKNEDHLRSPPSILLLATHRDLVEGCELPKPLLDGLKAIVLPHVKNQLIYCDEQLEKFIFTMNAKKPEDRDRKTANDIRKVITEKCPGEKVRIPIRWHNLDHQSRRFSDCLNRKVLSREEYGKIANELNIDERSCEGALNFFHSLNTILYFPKVLPDVVFLEPQILLNLLNELVAKKYRADQHAIRPKQYDFQFHEVAQVTKKLLDEFKEHYHPPLFTSKELTKLFEKLLIFGKLEEGTWFVPCILPSLTQEEVEKYRESGKMALLIHFPDGGPQNGIFCSTVSFFLSTDNTSPGPWRVLRDAFSKPKCMKRNIIAFSVGNFPGKVTLIEEWTHFEAHVKKSDPIQHEDKIWKLVYDAVFDGLEKATEAHHCSKTVNCPQPAIICRGQHDNYPSTPHPATINCKGEWRCTQCKEYGGQVTAYKSLVHSDIYNDFAIVTWKNGNVAPWQITVATSFSNHHAGSLHLVTDHLHNSVTKPWQRPVNEACGSTCTFIGCKNSSLSASNWLLYACMACKIFQKMLTMECFNRLYDTFIGI